MDVWQHFSAPFLDKRIHAAVREKTWHDGLDRLKADDPVWRNNDVYLHGLSCLTQ